MQAANTPKLDLSLIDVKPFNSTAVTNIFSCGKPPIDRFLKNKAKKANNRLEQKVFTAHLNNSPECIGYYALQVGSDSVANLPNQKQSYLQNMTAFPAIHLSFLGVHIKFQRQKLGEYLLMDIFEKVASISDNAAFHALTLQSLDQSSTQFYESLGFAVYIEGSQPKMLYPLKDILLTVRN